MRVLPRSGKHANARLAHRDPRQTGGGEGGNIERAKALAGAPQRHGRIAVAARRQHAVAGTDFGQRLGVTVAHFHRVERRDAVGVGRHRLPDFDSLRRRAATGTACSCRRRAYRRRPAPSHRATRCAALGRAGATRIGGQRATGGGGNVQRPRRHRLDAAVDHRQHVGERRQPRNRLYDLGRHGRSFHVLDVVRLRLFSLSQQRTSKQRSFSTGESGRDDSVYSHQGQGATHDHHRGAAPAQLVH